MRTSIGKQAKAERERQRGARSGLLLHEGKRQDVLIFWASLVAHLVKNLPAMQETVQFLSQENLLEKG